MAATYEEANYNETYLKKINFGIENNSKGQE